MITGLGAATAFGSASGYTAAYFAAGDTSSDPLSALIGLGPVGIIAVLLITGFLRTRGEVESLNKRIEVKDEIIARKDAQIAALTSGYVDKAMPTLTRLATLLERIEDGRRGRGAT